MPYDFSDVPDEVLNSALANTWALPEDARVAASVERARRDAARREGSVPGGAPAAAAPNVEQNLAAAATPIAVEPMAGPSKRDAYAARMEAAGYTPQEAGMASDYEGTMEGAYELPESDETLRRGAAYQREQDRRMGQFDASLADAMGHNVGPDMSTEIMPNAGSRPAWAENAFGGEMINVDGVMVQAYDLGDGKMRYRLGDVKRAQEEQMGAQRDASWRAMIDDDKLKYGDPMLKDDQVTQEQYDNRNARKRAEVREVMQNRALRENPNRAAFEREVAARRALVARNAMLAGGSQNLNPMMRAQIGALREAQALEATDPDAARSLRYTLPGGRFAAEVDKSNADAAMRIVERQNIGALLNRDAEVAMGMRAEQRMQGGRALAGQAAQNAGGLWGGDPRTAADRALIRAGYSAAERAMILDEMFGGAAAGQQATPATPAPAGPLAPLPLPEGHNHPVRVPDGTYPMM